MKLFFITTLFLFSIEVFSQVDPVDEHGLAIGGYDLVNYFLKSKAEKGRSEFSSKIQNVTYYFVSKENQKLFDSNPKKFLPQYDGYCALAVGTTAKKISIDPETFKVTDGKLYLFFNGKSWSGTTFNSLEPWIKDENNLITKADKLWPEVKRKKYKAGSRK
jgi:YHS domain-containing protein